MSTPSTKQRRRKRRSAANPAASRTEAAEPVLTQPVTDDVPQRVWLVGCTAIFLVAAFLRIYNLDLVPFHHDEGVNGNFLVRLVREGVYTYDPGNYHGPTLYYFSAIIPWILRFLFGPAAQNSYGLNDITVRLVPACFGLGTIGLVFLLRRQLGSVAALSAAALLAISPGAVYLSRYFIHETLFVFFTLGVVVAALRYYESGHPVYLLLAAVSAALLFATKETAIISAGVLLIALATAHIYLRLRNGPLNKAQKAAKKGLEPPGFVTRAGGPKTLGLWSLVAIVVFLGVNVLFYSSFFTNYPKGVNDAIRTFEFWTKTGKEAHVHSLHTYVLWLLRQESSLLLLGAVGAALIVWKPRRFFALFAALWAFGLIAAYSLIAYKTPWLVLNFIVPLALISGHVFQTLYEYDRGQWRLIIATMLLAVCIGGYQTINLNFFNYDNDDSRYVYVYAHTRRETLKLLDEIERAAKRSNQGKLVGITIVSPDYWPLPWYLRDYTRVGYYGRMADSNEQIIIAAETQGAEVETRFGKQYQQMPSGLNSAGSFPLRPGVSLLLYVRRDALAEPR